MDTSRSERVCVLPWTWCVTWFGGAECRGQHSSQPHTVGLWEDLSLRSGQPAEPGTLVKINKCTEDIDRDLL